MRNVTIAQQDEFWRALKEHRISSEQFQRADVSGLLLDVLSANFKERTPLDRWLIRGILGLKPLPSLSCQLSAWKLYESCRDTRLRKIIQKWIWHNERRDQCKTIGDFRAAIERRPLCQWGTISGKAILALVELLMDRFGIDIVLTPEDSERIQQYRIRSRSRSYS